MNQQQALDIVYAYHESQFPKACSTCGRRFETLADYIRSTSRIGRTISYDADQGDWETAKPMGTFALANCACGTTLALSTDGMPTQLRQQLLAWVKQECEQRALQPSDVIDRLRDQVRARALSHQR